MHKLHINAHVYYIYTIHVCNILHMHVLIFWTIWNKKYFNQKSSKQFHKNHKKTYNVLIYIWSLCSTFIWDADDSVQLNCMHLLGALID
jgi:hypothetical protein